MRRPCIRLLCGLALLLCLQLPAGAADKLGVTISGTALAGSLYASPVSLRISGAQAGERVLIREKGRWMALSPDESGNYQLTFTADGDYRLRFCAEGADKVRSGFSDARFTIDGQAAAFLEGCRRLPDLEQVGDAQLLSMQQELVALQQQKNGLDEARQEQLPDGPRQALEGFLARLLPLLPQQDILPPAAPQLLLRGEEAAGAPTIYRASVRIELKPPQQDFARLLVRAPGGEWGALEAADGVYALECSENKEYAYDFCTEDAAGNRSALRRAAFTISPGLFAFYESVGKHTGLGVEEALACYQLFDGRSCALVDETLVRQLWADYWNSCAQQEMEPRDFVHNREIIALGMLSGFYGKGPVRLEAAGRAAAEGQTAAGKQLLWEYELAFLDAQDSAIAPEGELLISVQLPPELLGKKNVTVLDAAGNPLESHLRNEDAGFVLTFPVRESGLYSVGADAPA